MASDDSPDMRSIAGTRARLSLVFATVLTVGVLFLYAGGWLSPRRVTQARIIDEFEHINGVHPGFRRNHAKGVGASGYFESNGRGVRLSKAVVFQPGRVTVVGRFALAGGMPYVADAEQIVRSMALLFSLPNGEEWRTGMNNTPVFAVRTPQAFYELLIATTPDRVTSKPDPEKVKAFLRAHPETARAMKSIKEQPPASGFENSTFNSLNAFRFIDEAGRSTPVRWSMVPVEPYAPGHIGPGPGGANFLFDALLSRLGKQPLKWHLVLTIGQPSDPTDDATLAWPAAREQVDVGTLVLDHVEGEATSVARTINFDPLVLPDGIVGSDDPLLAARSATYSTSFRRRVGEPASRSAVATQNE